MPRCKCCKEKFEAKQFLQKYCGVKLDCKVAEGLYNLEKKKKIEKKEWNKRKELMRPTSHSKENKAYLQSEINKLSKLIDSKFEYVTCIDCNKRFDNVDAGHYIAVGANATLRYNLDNIHAQDRGCNRNERQGSRNTGYYKGLTERYGKEYAEYVDVGLQNKYKYLGLKEQEIYDKLKLVRALVKNFETYKFKNSLGARRMFNKLIGIYE